MHFLSAAPFRVPGPPRLNEPRWLERQTDRRGRCLPERDRRGRTRDGSSGPCRSPIALRDGSAAVVPAFGPLDSSAVRCELAHEVVPQSEPIGDTRGPLGRSARGLEWCAPDARDRGQCPASSSGDWSGLCGENAYRRYAVHFEKLLPDIAVTGLGQLFGDPRCGCEAGFASGLARSR
jgi:hypothetical protein